MSSKLFEISLSGDKQVMDLLKALGEQAQPTMQAALHVEGQELLNDSLALVPVDTGALQGSGTIKDVDGSVPTVTVGYGGPAAPYALATHENPRSGRTGGIGPSGQKYKHWASIGQWKFLEQPFKERTAGFTDRIAASLRKTLLRDG